MCVETFYYQCRNAEVRAIEKHVTGEMFSNYRLVQFAIFIKSPDKKQNQELENILYFLY